MGGLAMEIHIERLEITQQKLKTLGTALAEGMEPALMEIGELGSKYFGGIAFQSKGSAFGEAWDPLAASTVKEKSKNWPGRPDMVRTGEMQNSFSYEMQSPGVVRLFNAAPWFKYHQSASERSGRLPRRIMIGVNGSFRQLATGTIRKQVATIVDEVTHV